MIIIYFDKNLKKSIENQIYFIEIRKTFYGNEIYGADTTDKFNYLLSLFRKTQGNYYIISSGSGAEEFVNSEYFEEHRILDFIIFCFNKSKYNSLQNQYPIISMIEDKKFNNIIKHLKHSLPKAHPNEALRYCSSFLLISEYYGKPLEVHKKLFEYFDENYSTPSFNENIKIKILNLLSKLAHTDYEYKQAKAIIDSINNEIDIIRCYTSESIIVYFLNKCLREIDEKFIEFAGLLNYALYKYYNDHKEIHIKKDMTFYRKVNISIKDLHLYDLFEGYIICFPSFISTSNSPNAFYCQKVKNKKLSCYNGEFIEEKNVLFKIHYKYNELNYCPAFNIKNVSAYKYEKEYLFPPFSFFRISKFISNEGTNSNPVIIELEVIPSKENLGRYLKSGGKIIYDIEENYMVYENKNE